MYLTHASTAAGVSRDMLERELAQPARGRPGRTTRAPLAGTDADPREQRGAPVPPPDIQRVRRADRRRIAGERALGAERELVRVLLHRGTYLEQVIERVGAESFRDPEMSRIFAALVEKGSDAGPEAIADGLDAEAIVELQNLLEEPGGLDHADEAVSGALAAMHERELAERMREIDRELPLANSEEKTELTKEKMRLTEELRRLGGRWWKMFR
jgi:hypothetical protein